MTWSWGTRRWLGLPPTKCAGPKTTKSAAIRSGPSRALLALEQRDDLPERRSCDERVNDPAQHRHVAEESGNQVESEQADQAPVEAADDEQQQGNFVEYAHERTP